MVSGMTDGIRRMEAEAVYELLHYHEKSAAQKIKDRIKKAAGRYAAPEDLIFWPTGLLADTLAGNLDVWEDRDEVLSALYEYFDRWIGRGMPIFYLDDLLCGNALIELYQRSGDKRYLAGINRMAQYLLEGNVTGRDVVTRKDFAGSFVYRPAQKNSYIFADGIGMLCPFLAKYGALFGDERALDTAVLQITNMLGFGMDNEKFLPYHGYEYENKTKYGIIGWGRAVGWLLMGMSGTLEYLPAAHDKFTVIAEAFCRLAEAAAAYQREDGSFAWQLEALEGPADSSASAMIGQAFLKGKRIGVLSHELKNPFGQDVAEHAAEFIVRHEKNGKIGQCSGECKGFSEYPQAYGEYPWSLGPGLEVILGRA